MIMAMISLLKSDELWLQSVQTSKSCTDERTYPNKKVDAVPKRANATITIKKGKVRVYGIIIS